MTRKARKNTPIAAGRPKIYLGPTLKSVPISQNTIFKNGALPRHVAAHQDLKMFIVDLDQIAEIEKKIADKLSIYHVKYTALKGG